MIKINEYNELKMFVETTSIEADSLDDFIEWLLDTITKKELYSLSIYDYEVLYEAFKEKASLDTYKTVAELGADLGPNSSLFEDEYEDGTADDEEVGQFYLDNYKNNYSSFRDFCLELNSGRVLIIT